MAAAPQFTFDEAAHRYEVDGVAIPSVTQIIQGCGLADYSAIQAAVLEYKSELGSAVHAFCQYLDEGEADWGQVEGTPIEPYCVAYERFRAETSFVPHLIEHRMVAKVNGQRYGMALDRLGFVADRRTVLEIKCTAAAHASHGVQLAAYDLGIRLPSQKPSRRLVVRLKDSGDYSLEEYKDPTDERAFLWALALTHWKGTVKL